MEDLKLFNMIRLCFSMLQETRSSTLIFISIEPFSTLWLRFSVPIVLVAKGNGSNPSWALSWENKSLWRFLRFFNDFVCYHGHKEWPISELTIGFQESRISGLIHPPSIPNLCTEQYRRWLHPNAGQFGMERKSWHVTRLNEAALSRENTGSLENGKG